MPASAWPVHCPVRTGSLAFLSYRTKLLNFLLVSRFPLNSGSKTPLSRVYCASGPASRAKKGGSGIADMNGVYALVYVLRYLVI